MTDTASSTVNIHDIRLQSRGETFSAGCSCGWSSPEELARSAAAHEAVAHSTVCVGDAKMGGGAPVPGSG